MKKEVIIVDYGMGNLKSVSNALSYHDINHSISSSISDLDNAETLILPGVGSFKTAMNKITESGLRESIMVNVKERGKKILGICLGFQLLTESSTEEGYSEGLGLIPLRTTRINPDKSLKIPHIGFNSISNHGMTLFQDCEKLDFYFIHSYKVEKGEGTAQYAFCDYGGGFVAAYQNNNVIGTQFHPEKSQINGLRFINNFINH